MQQIIVMGHLGNDPEVRYTSGGQKVTGFSVAVNQKRGGKEETMWFRATIWGDHLDKMVSYLKKGSGVILSGDFMKPEIYEDRSGQSQISLNITVNSISFSPFGKGGDRSQEGSSQGEALATPHSLPSGDAGATPFSEDDIPF
ncbi:MAG: single-stranded DNA-binding protein [Chlamydiota bacterium]|nr:single-stranded DNA-binding protein [Chlamydiota bacterium]